MGISYKTVCNLCEREGEYELGEKILMEQEMLIWKSDMNYTISICPKCRKKLFINDMAPLFDELDCVISDAMKKFYKENME